MNYPNADSYSSRSNFPPIGACGGQAVVLPLLTGLRYTLILQDTELLRKVKNNVTWERLEPVHKSALTENANWDAAPKSTTLPTRPRRTAAWHGCSGRVYTYTLGYTCTNSYVRPLPWNTGVYPSPMKQWAPKSRLRTVSRWAEKLDRVHIHIVHIVHSYVYSSWKIVLVHYIAFNQSSIVPVVLIFF